MVLQTTISVLRFSSRPPSREMQKIGAGLVLLHEKQIVELSGSNGFVNARSIRDGSK